MSYAVISALGLIAAGAVGFIIGIVSNIGLAKRLQAPHHRCGICFNRHTEGNHESFEGWDR